MILSLFCCCSFSYDSSAIKWSCANCSSLGIFLLLHCLIVSFAICCLITFYCWNHHWLCSLLILVFEFCFVASIVFLSSVLDYLLSLLIKCLSICLKHHKIHQITTIILKTIKILAPFMEAISTFIPQILLLLNLFLSPSMAPGSLIGKDLLCLPYPLKKKLCFIDGSLPEPPLNHINYAAWHSCNDMFKIWLHWSLVKNIAKSVYYCKTTTEIWNDLEERYGQAIASQLYSLRQSLLDVKQESDESFADFYTKIKRIWDEIDMHDPLSVCSCNACNCTSSQKNLRSQQPRRVMSFLMKLTDDFKQVRSNVLCHISE